MRSLFLYNSILFLGLPFCDQKGSEKVSLLRGSALGGQNDGRHPAKLARSPYWTPSGPKFLYKSANYPRINPQHPNSAKSRKPSDL